jgi:hypothetical protein
MKLKETSPKNLTNRYERACARLARIARNNTVFGGASALLIAKRCKFKIFPADEIVSDVYRASNYSCGKWGAYECPECGQAHLGEDSALGCCAWDEENEE